MVTDLKSWKFEEIKDAQQKQVHINAVALIVRKPTTNSSDKKKIIKTKRGTKKKKTNPSKNKKNVKIRRPTKKQSLNTSSQKKKIASKQRKKPKTRRKSKHCLI